MLLVLSRPTNPNWQGRKAWGPPSSPVKQAFQRSPGKSRALQEQPPSRAGVVSITTLQPLYAASTPTPKVDPRNRTVHTHRFRLEAEGATFPSSGLLGIQVA